MRKVIVSNLITLDGYFEGINQDLNWFKIGEDFFEYARKLVQSVDGILYGRITYEHMTAYWPTATDNDKVITERMNNLQKFVFSKTLSSVNWKNSVLINEKAEEEVKKLKQQPGKDLVIFGSSSLVSLLTQNRLIDEYRLIINPVILNNGNPMFKNLNEKIELKLIKTQPLSSGSVILSYTL